MTGLNRVELIGYVGKDPICTIVGEKKVERAKFAVAVSRDYDKEKTDWINCVCFGGIVSNLIKPYLKKGALVYVCGRLEYSNYEDSDGQKKVSVSVRVIELKIISTKATNVEEGESHETNPDATDGKQAEPIQEEIDDDSLPF